MLDQRVDPTGSSGILEPRFHPPGDTSDSHRPAVSTQATKTVTAGVGGQKRVLTALSFHIGGSALAATTVGCFAIDGASGTTTYRWQEVMTVDSTGGRIVVTGLNIVCAENTALTVEFDRAVTGGYESVNFTYHTIGGTGT